HGAVLVVGRQDLVAGLEIKAPRHHVDRRARVREIHGLVGRHAHILGQRPARLGQQRARAPAEKLYRLPLELALPALILLEHRPRTRTVGAVIQEDDVRIEQEERLQLARGAHRCRLAMSIPGTSPPNTGWIWPLAMFIDGLLKKRAIGSEAVEVGDGRDSAASPLMRWIVRVRTFRSLSNAPWAAGMSASPSNTVRSVCSLTGGAPPQNATHWFTALHSSSLPDGCLPRSATYCRQLCAIPASGIL